MYVCMHAYVFWLLIEYANDKHLDNYNRVHLQMKPGIGGSDYINASFIDVSFGYTTKKNALMVANARSLFVCAIVRVYLRVSVACVCGYTCNMFWQQLVLLVQPTQSVHRTDSFFYIKLCNIV